MSNIKIEKVLNSVPEPYSPNTISLVKKPGIVATFVSDDLGNTLYKLNANVKPTINGPVTLVKSLGLTPETGVNIASYTITNYSNNVAYDVFAITGSVNRVNDIIFYTAPLTVGQSGFIINGYLYQIPIIDISVNKPIITYPTNSLVSQTNTLNCTCSAFGTSNDSDSHDYSDWQLATDINFTTIVNEIIASSPNEVSWELTNLVYETTYYLRTRQKGITLGYSEWSDVITFSLGVQPPVTEIGIIKGGNLSNDNFGYMVELTKDGTRGFITAFNSGNASYTDPGVVYVYTIANSELTLETQLVPSTPATNDNFGNSLAASTDGSTLVIGCANDDHSGFTDAGSVYIFTRTGTIWSQIQSIISPAAASNGYFGLNVTISGDGNTIAIASPYEASGRGLVYVYQKSGATWNLVTSLYPTSGAAGHQTGYNVRLSEDGTRLVSGAYWGDGNSCAVYKNTAGVWAQEALLPTSNQFGNGFNVDINNLGDTIAIGGCYENTAAGSLAGKVFIFTRTGSAWSLQTTLTASDGADSEYFGSVVRLSQSGDKLLTSARNDSYASYSRGGSVYVFTRNGSTWTQINKIIPIVPITNGSFGASIGLSANGLLSLVGSNNDVNNVSTGGNAYLLNV